MIYASPQNFGFYATALAVLFFTFQIYCDFSGYSDMARGISSLFGIQLMQNFNQPYFSKSISEFWRRWHISLSTWFKDYLYIPLGGNRVSTGRMNFNLMIVFMVSGLWHGANWTFVIWGFLHGLYLISEKYWITRLGMFRSIVVFILVALAWVFFRANHFDHALQIFAGFSRPIHLGLSELASFRIEEGLFAVFVLMGIEKLNQKIEVWSWIKLQQWPIRWSLYWALIFIFLITAQFNGHQFIYFQF
jgi:D-alanyl-lipoteichoic acid acyltransferase DltB (MBOAT superfamily)